MLKCFIYTFAFTLAIFAGLTIGHCQEKVPLTVREGLTISEPTMAGLTDAQQCTLQLAKEQSMRASVEADLARLRQENAQLRYSLTILQAKISLKLGEDYDWDDGQARFIKRAKAK